MTKYAFMAGIAGGIAALLIAAYFLQPAESKTVIIQQGGGGGGCTDLECLDDVVFDNPSTPFTNQILIYNGTVWHNTLGIPNSFERACQAQLAGGTATFITCIPTQDTSGNQFDRLLVVIEGNITSSTYRPALRFNFPPDTGANYAYQSSTNLGAYNTGTDQTSCALIPTSAANAGDRFLVYFWMTNIDTVRKLAVGKMVYGADTSDSTLQTSIDFTCKWDNTTGGTFGFNAIHLVRTSGTGSLGINSVITAWGYTPST